MQTQADAQTGSEQKPRTGKINISLLTLHLLASVFQGEEETESLKVQTQLDIIKSPDSAPQINPGTRQIVKSARSDQNLLHINQRGNRKDAS